MGVRRKERGCLLGDQCGRRSWKARGGPSEPGWGYPKYGSMDGTSQTLPRDQAKLI